MSKLRKKLQQARHEYQHLHYPGDLAADLADQLPSPAKRPSRWVRNLSIAATLALAATAALVVINGRGTSEFANDLPTTVIAPAPNPDANVTTSTNQNGITAQTDSGTQAAPSADESNSTQEQWSLVPSGVALVEETSFSLVPSSSSMSFGVPSMDWMDEAAEDQTQTR